MYVELWGLVRSAVASGDWSWAWSYASSCEHSEQREALERYVWRAAQDDRDARRSVARGELVSGHSAPFSPSSWLVVDEGSWRFHAGVWRIELIHHPSSPFDEYAAALAFGEELYLQLWAITAPGGLDDAQQQAQDKVRQLLVPALGFVF